MPERTKNKERRLLRPDQFGVEGESGLKAEERGALGQQGLLVGRRCKAQGDYGLALLGSLAATLFVTRHPLDEDRSARTLQLSGHQHAVRVGAGVRVRQRA